MATGIVKMFDPQRGFGFIRRENKDDVFCHWTAIVAQGYKTLTVGQHVEFDVTFDAKGRAQAAHVRSIEEEPKT